MPKSTLWGSGRPVREWLYVEDAAEGIVRAAERYDDVKPLNIAVGKGLSIAELASMIAAIAGYEGQIVYDSTKPDGALRKTGDMTRMERILRWQPSMPLEQGIRSMLDWFVANYEVASAE